MRLGEKDLPDQRTVARAVRRWLIGHGGWLVVFDNASDARSLHDFLPTSERGHVLITSRDASFLSVGGTLPLDVFDRPASIEFLRKRSGRTGDESADALAEALGDLPLALEQAAGYVEETSRSFAEYSEDFTTRQTELLRQGAPPGHPTSVAATVELSMDAARVESASSVDLARLFAFLAPDEIPRDLATNGWEHLPDTLQAVVADRVAMDAAIAVLRRVGLIDVAQDGFSMHRLTQAVIRNELSEHDRNQFAEAAVKLVNGAFPYDLDLRRTWPECARLLPHALAAATHAEERGVAADAAGHLLNETGSYQMNRAEFDQARRQFERALAIDEKALGPEDLHVADRLRNLAVVLRDQGDLAGAKKRHERALAIGEKAYGRDHPKVAIGLINLALILSDDGDVAGAKEFVERALEIFTNSLGENHPRTVKVRAHLESLES